MERLASPLAGVGDIRRLPRLMLFLAWLIFVVWLSSRHVFWRDEVRGFSLALSGADIPTMLRNIHGEGHPALWYLILRVGHDLFHSRHLLQVAGTAIGIAAMAILVCLAPFRTAIVALILFSLFGAFEYVVMARNYGLSMLVMFALAALYPRVRNTLWLGLILALLCNTNVPACLLAAALLLFRFVEMLSSDQSTPRRDWSMFAGNAALSLAGAILCFITVYPTANDLAAPSYAGGLGIIQAAHTLVSSTYGFASLGMSAGLLAVACLGLIRKPAGLIAALAGLLVLKLFFVLVFPSSYRHELLYLVFLIALYWMTIKGAGGRWPQRPWMTSLEPAGQYVFLCVLLVQTALLYYPLRLEARGLPYSRSAAAARLVQGPELRGAILMADPDTMIEPMAYYAPGHPLWFLRVQRFGTVVPLSRAGRRVLTLDEILADARRLNMATGRPVVFFSKAELRSDRRQIFPAMYSDVTVIDPTAVKRFLAATSLLASLRGAGSDESYDV
ncbi:MAG: hypothetical protein ABIW33_06615, partial [Sphingomicrobium sp.]